MAFASLETTASHLCPREAASERFSAPSALPAFDARGLMGKFPLFALLDESRAVGGKGKWVTTEASFEANW